jgi:hypothetical protein
MPSDMSNPKRLDLEIQGLVIFVEMLGFHGVNSESRNIHNYTGGLEQAVLIEPGTIPK